jgi:6-phosphogluconolactonase
LNAARHVFFLVSGAAKAATLQRVLDGARDATVLPAQGIAPRHGRVVWVVDRAARPT